MSVEKVFPSAGHHDKDPGAVANGYVEMKEMDRFRNLLIEYLMFKGHRYITDENWETNTQYQSRIKPMRGDVVLDMHLNAAGPSATGVEVFVSNNASDKSKAFAKELVDGCAEIMGIANRGVKTEAQSARGRLGILNKPGIAALVEFCFITNVNDMKAFHDNEMKQVQLVGDLLIKYDENK
ncbi:N-acetylmuramoyl-L-alanine amidase [Myroides marinus]|uniref:N-acetylmuramoyl-L-alanine amidase n=1 Tax=Myroides marinus TaxID=703342 RepID=UPI002577076B|nr:N-acetylmuramoyl-L-alanine amidase [Myroides marinus]MDM1378827.1 N-acetylmuramoyl-L-alanine amidase [Myroides marinus]MDM1386098.1 N-acetylmuramoyl-L-alanine amidase [Myroides marinus]MDM1393311.1 N-acetylmuramoyl-L-alanine amidase [Myroides marinus]